MTIRIFFLLAVHGNFKKKLVQHDIDQMTFDKIVFICQTLYIQNQLTNQVIPKNYPNFTQPVSNSNAFSTNNIIFPVRGYITPQFPRFITPVIVTTAQIFV